MNIGFNFLVEDCIVMQSVSPVLCPWLQRDLHNKFQQQPIRWIAVIEAGVPDKLHHTVTASDFVLNNKPTAVRVPL
jgi:hypothetical protein